MAPQATDMNMVGQMGVPVSYTHLDVYKRQGFTIAIVMLAGVREKIEHNDVPYSFQGSPIVLITSGLMAIAFFGFSGLI